MGEILYARLNWSVSTNDMFRNGQTDWKRMKAGFERMVQDHPDPWNVNNFAKFACVANDWETVKNLTATIGEKPIVMAWFDDLEIYTACRTRAQR